MSSSDKEVGGINGIGGILLVVHVFNSSGIHGPIPVGTREGCPSAFTAVGRGLYIGDFIDTSLHSARSNSSPSEYDDCGTPSAVIEE